MHVVHLNQTYLVMYRAGFIIFLIFFFNLLKYRQNDLDLSFHVEFCHLLVLM